jgi:hypothetical protein
MGWMCIPRNRALGHNLLMRDYFAEVTTYPPHLFRRWYRMRQSLFNKIIDMCEDNTRYFKRKRNVAGLMGFRAHKNISPSCASLPTTFRWTMPMSIFA